MWAGARRSTSRSSHTARVRGDRRVRPGDRPGEWLTRPQARRLRFDVGHRHHGARPARGPVRVRVPDRVTASAPADPNDTGPRFPAPRPRHRPCRPTPPSVFPNPRRVDEDRGRRRLPRAGDKRRLHEGEAKIAVETHRGRRAVDRGGMAKRETMPGAERRRHKAIANSPAENSCRPTRRRERFKSSGHARRSLSVHCHPSTTGGHDGTNDPLHLRRILAE